MTPPEKSRLLISKYGQPVAAIVADEMTDLFENIVIKGWARFTGTLDYWKLVKKEIEKS